MRYRILVGSGFAAGLLIGAWAGRDRYNAVMRRARGFKDNPSVHATAGLLQAQAAGAVANARRAVVTTPGRAGGSRGMAPYGSANGARPEAGGSGR